jgi:hypothetical protein
MSRCLGWVVFRVWRDENGSPNRVDGEFTTTNRDYLKTDGKWWWDANEARRFASDGEARAAADVSEEPAHVAMLYPSRASENAAAAESKKERTERKKATRYD